MSCYREERWRRGCTDHRRPCYRIGYATLLDAIARISNHFADRCAKPRAKLFINVADPDLRLAVTIAAMHCGMIPFALLEIGEPRAEVDYDYVIGAAKLQVPDLKPDLTIDDAVLSGRLADPVLREFPELPDDALLLIGSTTGTTGRRKLVAETYGIARYKEIVPEDAGPEVPSWMHVHRVRSPRRAVGDVALHAGATLALQPPGTGRDPCAAQP